MYLWTPGLSRYTISLAIKWSIYTIIFVFTFIYLIVNIWSSVICCYFLLCKLFCEFWNFFWRTTNLIRFHDFYLTLSNPEKLFKPSSPFAFRLTPPTQAAQNFFQKGALRLESVWPDWAIYCTLGNSLKPVTTIILLKSPTFWQFLKGSKSFIFLVKSFLVNFL